MKIFPALIILGDIVGDKLIMLTLIVGCVVLQIDTCLVKTTPFSDGDMVTVQTLEKLLK